MSQEYRFLSDILVQPGMIKQIVVYVPGEWEPCGFCGTTGYVAGMNGLLDRCPACNIWPGNDRPGLSRKAQWEVFTATIKKVHWSMDGVWCEVEWDDADASRLQGHDRSISQDRCFATWALAASDAARRNAEWEQLARRDQRDMEQARVQYRERAAEEPT